MIRKSTLLLGLMVLCLTAVPVLAHCGHDHAVLGSPPPAAPLTPEYVPGELLVDLRDDIGDAGIAAMEQRLGIDLVENGPASLEERVMRVRTDSPARLLSTLSSDPDVEGAEPNYIYRALGVPNDPLYKYQWHMDQVRGPAAWDKGAGRADIVVAVIDTGVAYEDYGRFKKAKDLKGTRFVPGWDFIHRNDHPNDDHAHGTHVAGTIAQTTNNNEGVAGVAYNCAIMPLKVLSAQGSGTVGDIADSIRWAADKGAHVINMSLGGSGFSRIMKEACDYAKKKGVTIVCAAGNNGQQRVSYPAAYPACIAVSATRFDEQVTWYSNYGKEICVAAPGGDTREDQNGDGYPDGVLQNTIARGNPAESTYELFQGTSMASPHAAGVAALIISQGVKDPDKVREILMKTARPKGSGRGDIKYGAGIVDASAAQKMAAEVVGNRRLVGLTGLLALTLWTAPLAAAGRIAVALAALAAGSGFYFLPAPSVLAHPALEAPAWLLGISANALTYSALLPIALIVLLFGSAKARLLAAGAAIGMAAHLFDTAFFTATDVAWVPGTAGWLDAAWLSVNAFVAAALARVSLKGGAR